MFGPCPHCQFLVAHQPQLRPLPAACPRCGLALQESEDADAGNASIHTPPQSTYPGGAGMDETSAVHSMPDDDPLQAAAPIHAPAAAEQETTAADATTVPAASTSSPATEETGDPADAVASLMRVPIATPHALPRWRWPLIVLLGLLLGLQILLADRAQLAADPRWRPLLETLCGALRCDLPPWDEPGAFTMLDRKVRPATQPGALRVDATFRNDARWPQPWPALQLALSDADGRVLGSRVFQPVEYLGAAPTTLLSPDQSAQITFVVREPAPGTVAFSFEFR
jgi:hypothetical protein